MEDKLFIKHDLHMEIDSYDDDDDEEKEQTELECNQDEILYNLIDTRNNMIEYCNEMNLPLCDYISHDYFDLFYDFLVKNS